MLKFLKKYAWSMYLGGSLAVFGLPFSTVGFWVIMIPTTILVVWCEGNGKEK